MTGMGPHWMPKLTRAGGGPARSRGRGPRLALARAVPVAVALTCACLSWAAPMHHQETFFAEPFRPRSAYAAIGDPTVVGRQSQASVRTNLPETALASAAGGVANSTVQTVYMGKNPVAVAMDG